MGRVTGSLRWENDFDMPAGGALTVVTTPLAERHPKHAETISNLGGKNVPGELAANAVVTPANANGRQR